MSQYQEPSACPRSGSPATADPLCATRAFDVKRGGEARTAGAGISTRQRALLHVAKAQLGMSDDAYRALLARVAGVTSSKELDRADFDPVMTEFERLGFRSIGAAHARGAERQREGMATPAQLRAIASMWRQFTGSNDERALARWLERHIKVSHPRFLDAVAAGKCIAILRHMLAWKAAHADSRRRRARAADPS